MSTQTRLKEPKPGQGVKSADLAALFREKIGAGSFGPGDRLPSFSQLRETHGVAHNTVERAYAALEREGFVRREQGRGVFVADKMAKPRQHAIGIAGFELKASEAPYWVHLMEGIQEVVQRAEMEIVILHPTSRRGLERIDGVLLHGDKTNPVVPAGMPVVTMVARLPGRPGVQADDAGGMQMATEHLISLGHRRIACLVFTVAPVVHLRLAGYRAALAAHGIRENSGWVRDMEFHGNSVHSHACGTMTHWLQSGWKKLGCTALLCQNDGAALGAMQALRENGLRVPQDVSVVGFDGTEEAEQSVPPLTSVYVPLREIGTRAVELLFRQIHEGRAESGVLTLPTTLQVRGSTAPPAELRT